MVYVNLNTKGADSLKGADNLKGILVLEYVDCLMLNNVQSIR